MFQPGAHQITADPFESFCFKRHRTKLAAAAAAAAAEEKAKKAKQAKKAKNVKKGKSAKKTPNGPDEDDEDADDDEAAAPRDLALAPGTSAAAVAEWLVLRWMSASCFGAWRTNSACP